MGRRLPAGLHGIPPDLIARNQRERLIAAVAEVCAEKSYAEVAVTDIVQRAGVSTATFYKRFDGKRDCMLAAHAELLARLLEEVDRVCAESRGWRQGVRAALGTVLALFAADPPTARLLTIEILALGPEGAERHDVALRAFAERLRAGRDPRTDSRLVRSDWVVVAAIAALIGRFVMAGEAAALPALEGELVELALAPSR